MIFKAPLLLLLLGTLPLLAQLMVRAERKRAAAAAILHGPKVRGTAWKKRMGFQLGALAAVVIALAQPAWNPHPGPLKTTGRNVVIALDISRSMLAEDVFPNRLDAAKIALYESLPDLRGQKIGLITFAGAASVRVPLTLDHAFVHYMLERAQPSDATVGSTSLQAAIEKAVDTVLTESEPGSQDILIFTDGEDHISDIETTAQELRECGARVLIVGLGDPVAGARVPALADGQQWMQYEEQDVITRLDEDKLAQLSSQSPNVIYYPARTRPFDLSALYSQLAADCPEVLVDEESGEWVYTDGYPFFIALALFLWLLPLQKRLLLLLALTGCAPEIHDLSPEYQKAFETGRALWVDAQEPLQTDPRTALYSLREARESFLTAALIRPGDEVAAEQIAGVSAQIRTVEAAVEEQERAEKDLQKQVKEAIERLRELVEREQALAQTSQRVLRRRPPLPAAKKAQAVAPARTEQAAVAQATHEVSEIISRAQQQIKALLDAAFTEGGEPPGTEFDQPLILLQQAQSSQQTALENLAPKGWNWPQVNIASRTAARLLQEAHELLDEQNQGQDSDGESEMSEGEDGKESDSDSNQSAPMKSSSFQSALENRALPTPNYTAEEILMEEAANMEQRAQQQANRAGADVEKNW